MLIAGIILQLVAGIIFGLTHILPKKRFKSANERLRRFLLFPSEGKRRLRILIYGALITPVASLLAIYLLTQPISGPWYETIVGVFLGWMMAAIFYLSLLRRFAQLISKTTEPKNLPDDAYFRTLLFGNLILIPVLGGLAWLSYWGNSALSPSIANIGNIPEAVILFLRLLLVFIFSFSALSGYMAVAFVVLAGITNLVISRMARADKPLWIIVLSLFILGGAFLIASACRS